MTNYSRLAAALVVVLGGVGRLEAQEPGCPANETIGECWDRLDPGVKADSSESSTKRAVSEDQQSELGRKSTGITSLGDGLASSINDFLPTLAGALGLTQTTTEDGGTSFEGNFLLPFGSSPQRIRLQVLLRKPSLFEPLTNAIPVSIRDAAVASLKDSLRDFDDVRLSLAWNLENTSFGRSFERSRALYARLLDEAVGRFRGERKLDSSYEEALTAFTSTLALKTDIDSSHQQDPACDRTKHTLDKFPLSCFNPKTVAALTSAISNAVTEVDRVESQLDSYLDDHGFYEFASLIDNQPQFSVTFNTDLRRNLVGPNAVEISARYEGGFANVNQFRNFCGDLQGHAADLDCLNQYLASPGVRPSIKRGDRFLVTASFTRRSDYRATLTADSVDLAIKGTWDLTASAGYGRYVSFDKNGEAVGRIDLSADYVFHHDDPTRRNRLVAAGTYTYRVSSSLSFAAGISYASKPEFLGEVDKKFGANFGLRYKILKS